MIINDTDRMTLGEVVNQHYLQFLHRLGCVIYFSSKCVYSHITLFLLQDNPDEVVKALEKEGVEAYKGATQLSTVFRTKQNETDQAGGNKTQEETKAGKPIYSSLLSQTEVAAAVGMSPSAGSTASKVTPTSRNVPNEMLTSAEFVCSPPISTNGTNNAFCQEKDDILFPHNSKYLIDHVLYLPVHKRVSFWYLEHICNAVEKVMKNRVGVKIADTRNVLFQSKL